MISNQKILNKQVNLYNKKVSCKNLYSSKFLQAKQVASDNDSHQVDESYYFSSLLPIRSAQSCPTFLLEEILL